MKPAIGWYVLAAILAPGASWAEATDLSDAIHATQTRRAYLNRYVHEHHDALAPILREHYLANGVSNHRLREAIQDTVMWEAECSLDSINSYGEGYERLLLGRVEAGEGVTDARYSVQEALAAELAAGTYGPAELENRLRGSHARFHRCLTERLTANGLPPLPERRTGAPPVAQDTR